MHQKKNPIFITGCAGFIGFHLSKKLLEKGLPVLGLDNINDYYDQNLKYSRLQLLNNYSGFYFIKGSLEDQRLLESLFTHHEPRIVVHLAAQAGVRYSLLNPHAYIQSNVAGFMNILECCRIYKIGHLLYASSSSVYGNNKTIPFAVEDRTDEPVSLYAATKKANELMAYTYSHLYKVPATGLRFFTVYGPWGRPDMAYFSFAEKIVKKEPIEVYNYGNMKRDFTYVDDVTESIWRLMERGPDKSLPFSLYNIGNSQPVELNEFISVLEKKLGIPAIKTFKPMQPGDVQETYAKVDDLERLINYKPVTSIEEGLEKFAEWYKEYYDTEPDLKNPRL
ncbi:NAD-dependent epimerase/dehydratase family protein [Bacillus infantis]|uniref:NAD-dependent epimerase/dehydratase family protein n=1 Tax=Bacillus infantis TaxID=324767 RepID=UPI003CF4E78F